MSLFSREPPLTPEERARRRELEHAERMRLIETGQPLPEVAVARAKVAEAEVKADLIRSNVRVIFGALGPAAILGITTGGSALVLQRAAPSDQVALLIVLWLLAALVCLGMIAGAWAASRKPGASPTPAPPKAPARPAGLEPVRELRREEFPPHEREKLSRAIQE